jgi:hypothetical protein
MYGLRLCYALVDRSAIAGIDPFLGGAFGKISEHAKSRIRAEGNDGKRINFPMAHEFLIAGVRTDFLCLGRGIGSD